MLVDDKAISFAKKLSAAGVRVADEIGLEVVDEADNVVANAEIAWLDAKICYLTEEQKVDKDALVALGWMIIDDETDINTIDFGGNG